MVSGSSSAESPATGRDFSTTPISREEPSVTKTMTCQEMGGPCDFAHQGATADEVIKAQDRHLNEMVEGGDVAHEPALKDMKGRWKHPIAGMGWYKKTKRDFAALPEG
jgi:hypothetical protein